MQGCATYPQRSCIACHQRIPYVHMLLMHTDIGFWNLSGARLQSMSGLCQDFPIGHSSVIGVFGHWPDLVSGTKAVHNACAKHIVPSISLTARISIITFLQMPKSDYFHHRNPARQACMATNPRRAITSCVARNHGINSPYKCCQVQQSCKSAKQSL